MTGRGLAHFSGPDGPKNVPVPLSTEGDSPIFVASRQKNRDSPRERILIKVMGEYRLLPKYTALLGIWLR
jgi:hypothetical protein